MGLKSGSILLSKTGTEAWAGSMAKAIEDAFLEEWPFAMADQPKPELNDQMRLLFVAIAKGVVRHLAANGAAFHVDNSSENGQQLTHTHTATTTVQVDNA
jgi:hypothetical protein